MSKVTTTLYDYIHSELIGIGKNEFYNDGRLTFFDNKYAFIQKILMYDEDVEKIVNNSIFKGIKFTDEQIDKTFKSDFVARFMDREFSRQTVEAFASQVVHVTLSHQEYIELVYSELKKYANGTVTTTSKDEDETTSTDEHRNAKSTLPQSEVNINVDHDELQFADENTIDKDKHTNKGKKTSDSETKRYDPETLKQIYNMKEQIMTTFDRKCFLQIW